MFVIVFMRFSSFIFSLFWGLVYNQFGILSFSLFILFWMHLWPSVSAQQHFPWLLFHVYLLLWGQQFHVSSCSSLPDFRFMFPIPSRIFWGSYYVCSKLLLCLPLVPSSPVCSMHSLYGAVLLRHLHPPVRVDPMQHLWLGWRCIPVWGLKAQLGAPTQRVSSWPLSLRVRRLCLGSGREFLVEFGKGENFSVWSIWSLPILLIDFLWNH